jgi:DNA-binding LytR/AlgR family response regulator
MSESTIKILIVEDEMLIGAKIALFVGELGYEVTAILPRAEDTLVHLAENSPDIALLDINLKGSMDGIALAQLLQKDHHIPVVFLTANSDDATFKRAKEAKPYAFLTKPFKKLDLQRALELTISLLAEPNNTASEKTTQPEEENTMYLLNDRIFVRYKEKMVKIMLDSIIYIEAERNYCRIFTKTKEHLLSMPLKSLEEKLPPTVFQRIHRSYLVNLTHVEEVSEGHVVVAQKALPMSSGFREEFLRRIRLV